MGPKLKAALVLAAMYGLGTISGIGWQTYQFEHHHLRHVFMERRLARMKTDLKLTDQQEAAIRDIFKKAHERARQVNEEVSWDLSDIHRDSVRAIRGVLTPQQLAEFDRMHHKAHQYAHHPVEQLDPRGGPPGPMPPAPPGDRRPPEQAGNS